jgi:hypothetical protein
MKTTDPTVEQALERVLFVVAITGTVTSLVSITKVNTARKLAIVGVATVIAAFIPELATMWTEYRVSRKLM